MMNWVKRTLRGSWCKKLKRQHHEKPAKERMENGPSGSRMDLSSDKREDIDHGKEMPILEDEQLQQRTIYDDDQPHLGKDRQVVKGSQESLTTGFSTPEKRTCASCKINIRCEHSYNYMDAYWHPECFCCYVCDHLIHDHEFFMFRNYPCHKSCHKELYHLKCDVCKQLITSNYSKHHFFNQKVCNSHWSDGTPYCSSCQRMKPRDTRFFTLDDGRILCFECQGTIINDSIQCQTLYLEIQEFFEGLNLKITQQIPLLVVEKEALNEGKDLEKDENWHLPKVRGLCIPERAHRDKGDHNVETRKNPTRHTYQCDVTAILILYGLPRLMMGSLLAHEMMHAWLALNGYYPLNQEVEEGICQMVSHMWLNSKIMSSSLVHSTPTSTSLSSDNDTNFHFEKRLGHFFEGHIMFHTSPVYGDGFRTCNQAVLQYGFEHTLEHIKLTGKFPS